MRCCAASLGGRRPVSTRCPAPCAARYSAMSSPTEPSPPVTRYVASPRSSSGVASAALRAGQPGNIDRLIPQRDLVFPPGPAAVTVVDQPDHSSALPSGQIRQPAPQLWMFQGGGATEPPQAALRRGHRVLTGNPLCATGDQPDRVAKFGGRRGAEEPLCSAEDPVLHPLQRPHRRRGVRVEGREDAGCAAPVGPRPRRAARLRAFLVRVGHRQPQDPVPVPVCRQRVDQWLQRFGVIGDEQPGRGPRRASGTSPREPTSPSGSRSGRPRWTVRYAAGYAGRRAFSARRRSAGCCPDHRPARRVPRSGRPPAVGRSRCAGRRSGLPVGRARSSPNQYWRCWNG